MSMTEVIGNALQHDITEKVLEDMYDARDKELESIGASDDEVLADEEGDYVMVKNESDHSDNYQIDFKKRYLETPTPMQSANSAQRYALKNLTIEDLDNPVELKAIQAIMDVDVTNHDHKDEKCNCVPGVDE